MARGASPTSNGPARSPESSPASRRSGCSPANRPSRSRRTRPRPPRRPRAERAAALAHVAQSLCGIGGRPLGVMPLYHTMGVRSLLAMTLVDGCFVCLPRFDAPGALELIAREKVTNLYLVPTLYHD